MPGLAAVINSGVTQEDIDGIQAQIDQIPEEDLQYNNIVVPKLGFGMDSGGKLPCCISPAFPTTGTPTVANVQIEGAFPMVNGNTLVPAPGTNPCTVIPTPCTNPRIAVSTTARLLINGQAPVCVGDVLNASAAITVASGATSVTIGA